MMGEEEKERVMNESLFSQNKERNSFGLTYINGRSKGKGTV